MYIERTQLPCYLFRYFEIKYKLWVDIFVNVIYNCSEFKTKECNKRARLPMNSYMETPLGTFNYMNVQESLKFVNFEWKWLRNLVLCCTSLPC